MDYMPDAMSQTVSLVYSAGLGFCFGLAYDIIKIIFYSLTGSDKKLSTLRDIIYVFVCLCAHFLFMLVMCSGRVMMFTFLGEAAGLYVYFITLSSQIAVPLRCFAKKTRTLIEKICLFGTQIYEKFAKLLKNRHK